MEIFILADCDSVANGLLNSLRQQGLHCASTQILKLAAIGSSAGQFNGFCGVIFIATKQLESTHCEAIRTLNAAVDAQARLVAVSAAANPGAVLQAVRAGACDIITADDSLDDEIASFVARLRAERGQHDSQGKVISIVSCHSPNDSNVFASNLAAVIAARKKQCGLLDFHFRGGDLALLLKLKPQHTILDLFSQADTVDDAMFRQALVMHDSGIQLLAGPISFGDTSKIRVQTCQQVIALARRCWPVVVVNCEDIQHAEQLQALAASDEIILTTRLDIASIRRTQCHLQFLAQNQIPADHLHVVAMETGIAGELPRHDVKSLLKVANVRCIPHDPVAAIMSINVGNPIVLENSKARSAIAIREFVESLLGYTEPINLRPVRRSATAMKAAAMLAWNVSPFCKSLAH